MNRLALGLITIGSMVLFACGSGDDGSGVDQSKQMADLTPAEVMDQCEWSMEIAGGPGESFDCGDGTTATNNTVAECVAGYDATFYATCNLTVGDVENCFTGLDGSPCNLFTTEECGPFINCIFGS